jgi:shikimate kinase
MQQANKIFLIGFMGSGKTTTGKRLAFRLNWSFIDLDQEIELMTGMKIRDIFSEKGEPFFRATESEALHKMESVTNTVISTGGGSPCYGDNMDFMIRNGLTVYLKMTPDQLRSRLVKSSDKRPLLKDVGKEDLLEYIEGKLAEREKWYSRAEITMDGPGTNISALYSLVRKLIRE